MSQLVSESLALLRPFLKPPLFSHEAVTRLQLLARHFSDIPRLILECRLNSDDDQVDLSQAIFRDRAEQADLYSTLLRRYTDYPNSIPLRSIGSFVQSWSQEESILHRRISEVWMEYDGVDAAQESIPAVFIGLDPQNYHADSGSAIADSAVQLLTGKSMTSESYENLQYCFDRLPEGAKLIHVGIMLSREVPMYRLNFQRFQPDDIVPFLQSINWSGDYAQCAEWIRIGKDMCNDVRLDLDVGNEIGSHCSLEFFESSLPEHVERWTPFIDHLVRVGLCLPEKADMLKKWPGHIIPPEAEESWPSDIILDSLSRSTRESSVFSRGINHIKINLGRSDGIEAKAYLGFLHSWIVNSS